VRTGTLLGERVLTLESKGNGTMRPMEVIRVSRTVSPYSLTEAVSELTTNTAGTDTGSLNQSLDTLSATLDQLAPQLGPTFDGLTRLSQAINDRDDTLGELLKDGADVTKILSDRSQQVNTLILNANDLVAVLSERRRAIVELLVHTSALSKQLSGVIHDNEQRLAPTLDKLNAVTAILEKNRDNIAKALPGLAKFQTTLGETIGNGPYYQAYVPNLDIAQILQPWLDYAFGFRRGTNAGQPPDNAGPRAELPFNVQRDSRARRAVGSAAMSRNRLTLGLGALLMVLLVGDAAVVIHQVFFRPTSITAYFTTATAIYPGDEVRIAGVKVGTIESIQPVGTQAKMTLHVDRGIALPADAKAVIVAQNLVSAQRIR
jgi:ABC-type transporter Mla subunit MlaD